MKRLESVLAKILGIKEADITDETAPENVETWDSFNGLVIVSALEKEFNVTFTMQEITSVKNVKDIKKCLLKHGAILDGNDLS